jgi:sorbitol/mannitol transport system substrate-binding protein
MFLRILMCLAFVAGQASGAPRTLKVAAYELSPYITEEAEEHGYLYEIIVKAFSNAGYKLEFQFYPPLRAKSLVESGERDILIPSYSSPADAKNLAFSQPLHGSQIGYIRLRGELGKDKKVLQSIGTSNKKENRFGYEMDETDQVIRSHSEKTIQLIDMLNQNRLDVAVADKFVAAQAMVNKRPHLIGKLQFVEPPIVRKEFHVAFSKKKASHLTVLDDFNKALFELQKSGEYQQILMRYGYQTIENDPNTLSIVTVSNSDMKIMEEVSKAFIASHPGLKINWYTMEENLLRRRILSSIALDDGVFDVFTLGSYDTPIYAKNKWIEPFTKFNKDYRPEDILPSVRDSLSLDGKFYALPFYGETSMTYYRKDLFQKKGLTMPAHPSWDEIRLLAGKLHDPSNKINGICLRGKAGWGENVALLMTMVHSAGGRWFSAKWQPEITSAGWSSTLKFYVDLLKSYGPAEPYRFGFAENLKLFAEGRCAIWIDATVAASYLFDRNKSSISDHVGYTYAPTMKYVEGSQWTWSWALAVSKSSKKKALAQEFVQWATSPEYVESIAKLKGALQVPPGTRKSTYSEAYLKAAPFAAFVRDAMEVSIPIKRVHPDIPYSGKWFVEIPEFPAIGNSLGGHVSDIFKNKVTVEEALSLTQQDVRHIMYHSGYYSGAEPNSSR